MIERCLYVKPECEVYCLSPNMSVLTESPGTNTSPTIVDPLFNPEQEI